MKELLERSAEKTEITLRSVSEGAERWLYQPIPCLDYGFVYLVDYMGNDEAVVQAARVSYGKGTQKVSEDRGLIRYLRRHHHTTPFEMVEFKFHCKMPIFVARQWIRHRTANVNEYSGRYSVMDKEFYLPPAGVLTKQSAANRQGGSGEPLSPDQIVDVQECLRRLYRQAYEDYERFLEPQFDLRREIARIGLSVANYTQWYWKIDLHNLMHFLKLRLDAHAQYEIRVYAEAMARIVKDAVPICFEALEDYQLQSLNLSRLEIEFIKAHPVVGTLLEKEVRKLIVEEFGNKREAEEFVIKLKQLGLCL